MLSPEPAGPQRRAVSAVELDPHMSPSTTEAPALAWLSPRQSPFQILGFPWWATEGLYRRLPTAGRWPLPEAVDALANATAGGQIRFRTTSRTIAVRVTLAGPGDMPHMPASGQCGCDIYLGDPGAQRYLGTAWPAVGESSYQKVFTPDPCPGDREVSIFLPLYQGVCEIEIGLDPAALISPATPHQHGPVVIYGTSITQGGCATRPGMAYPAIMARRINAPMINMGFSGNGKGEPELAHTLAEIEGVSCFVLDYHANQTDPPTLGSTCTEFIAILRRSHPQTPIVVLTRPVESHAEFDLAVRELRERGCAVLREVVGAAQAAGDAHITMLDLSEVDLNEGTVDTVHPSDLGFLQLADAIAPTIATVLTPQD